MIFIFCYWFLFRWMQNSRKKIFLWCCNGPGVDPWKVKHDCVDNLVYEATFDNLYCHFLGSWVNSNADLFINWNFKRGPLKGKFLCFCYLIIIDKNPNKVLLTLDACSSIFLVDCLRSVVVTESWILNLGKTDIIIFFVIFFPLIRHFILFYVQFSRDCLHSCVWSYFLQLLPLSNYTFG